MPRIVDGRELHGETLDYPDGALGREFARQRYLDAIVKDAPAVLADLAGEPLTLARAVWAAGATDGRRWRWETIEGGALDGGDAAELAAWLNGGTKDEPLPPCRTSADTSALAASLTNWSRRHNLAEPWLLDTACKTLAVWCEFPETVDEQKTWAPRIASGRSQIADADRMFTFDHPGWDPLITSERDGVTMLHGAFEAALPNYLERLRRLGGLPVLVDRSGRTSPHVRSGRRIPPIERWLALYQVAGFSQLDIARQAGQERTAIAHGIKAAAKLIGIDVRPRGKSGRPPKPPG